MNGKKFISVKNICKTCGEEFMTRYKRVASSKGFCSYDCMIKNEDSRIPYLRTFCKNKGYKNYENMTREEMDEVFSKNMAISAKNTKDKKHATMKEKYGNVHETYCKSGTKSKINRYKNFLVKNNIVPENLIDKISQEEIDDLFLENFNKITKHGESIQEGRLNKNNGKDTYHGVYLKCLLEHFGFEVSDLETFTEEEIKQFKIKYQKDRMFYNHDVNEWKKTHLINANIIDKDKKISKKKIDKKYSEYISERFSKNSLHNENNGYLRSEKGWYNFQNIDKKMFYRSSWEKHCLLIIDSVIKSGEIIDVFEPDRISYLFNGEKRHYYPDIGYILKNGKQIIIEIKPKRLLKEKKNKIKIKTAKKKIKNFIVFTEKEVFSIKLKEILIGEKNE